MQINEALSRWLNRNAKGVTRTMVYDVFGQLVADYLGSSGSTLERENIYRGGQLLAVYETGASCFKSISQFVTDFYQGVLHRQPNSTELTNATTTLTQAQSQGQGQLIVAAQSLGTTLFTSPEYLSLNPDIPANRGQFVTDLYAGYLGRVPDGYGYQAWLNALNTGSSREDVRHGFAYSAEFQNDVGQLCVTMTSSGINYVLQDLQGSTRAVMNNNGGCSTIVSRHDYLPFGEEIWSGTGMRSLSQGYGTTDRNRQKYGLTERDDATGLDHTWWRKYESFAGRWTSPDPYRGSMTIANPQSFNRYSYVQNDPINFVDPTGLEWMCLVWGGWAGSWEIPLDCWEVNREPKSFGPSGGGPHPDGRGGGGGGGQGKQKPKPKPTPKPCDAKLTGDADVDRMAQYLFGESSSGSVQEYMGVAQTFMNLYNANLSRFGCQDWSAVLSKSSNADNDGGNYGFNKAASNQGISGLNPEECKAYKRAQGTAQSTLGGTGAVVGMGADFFWFASGGGSITPPEGGLRLQIGNWTFRNYAQGKDKKGKTFTEFGADLLKKPKCN